MWGIFLAYIRRQLSSRLRFRVFWEAGVTGFSWYQSQVLDLWCEIFTFVSQERPSSYLWLETSYNCTAIYIYYPLWYSVRLELAVLLKILIFDLFISLISTLPLEWSGFSSCFSSYFSIIFLDFVSWDWLLLAEVGSRIRVAQRKRGGFMMCREATWSLFCLSSPLILIFFAIPYFIWISGTKFL